MCAAIVPTARPMSWGLRSFGLRIDNEGDEPRAELHVVIELGAIAHQAEHDTHKHQDRRASGGAVADNIIRHSETVGDERHDECTEVRRWTRTVCDGRSLIGRASILSWRGMDSSCDALSQKELAWGGEDVSTKGGHCRF